MAIERGAFGHRVLGKDRQVGAALGPLHVDGESAVLAVHLEVCIRFVVAEALLGAQGIDGLLVRGRHINVTLGGAARGPASTVLVANGVEHHVAVLDAGAVKNLELEVGVVFGLVVAVGQTRGEGDVVAIVLAAVEDEEEGAGHVVAAEANGAPGALSGHAQAEVDVCVAVVGDGEGEGEAVVGRDEGGLARGVVGVVGAGRRREGCWEEGCCQYMM